MKNFRFIIFLALSLSICPGASASENVRISTIDYPPIITKFVPGLGYGIGCDLTIEAFKAVDTEVTFDVLPMARSVWSVTEKKYPANLGTVSWFVKDNKEHLIESFDFFNTHFLFFYKKSRFPEGLSYENLDEMRKYSIGNVRGSASTPVVEKADLQMDWTSRLELNFKKLDGGRFDIAISSDIAGWAVIRELFPDRVRDFATVGKPLHTIPVSLVFHNDETKLFAKFQKGVDMILENGAYYEIMKRYYGEDNITEDVLTPYVKEKMKKY